MHATWCPLLLQLPVDRSWTTASTASTRASLHTVRRVPARRESRLESRFAYMHLGHGMHHITTSQRMKHPVVRRYTMLGTGFEPELNGAGEEVRQLRGLIPRVFDDMFTRLTQMGEQTEVRNVAFTAEGALMHARHTSILWHMIFYSRGA